jgi:nuclear pore complex protein Nup98-Nup96
MNEEELIAKTRAGTITRKRNALVQDEDGEIRYAHEVNEAQTRGSMNIDPTIIPWAQRIGIDAQKMHVMQTSLFRMPEEAAALKALHQDTGTKPSRKRLDIPSPPKVLSRKHGRESDGDAIRSDSREVCGLIGNLLSCNLIVCKSFFRDVHLLMTLDHLLTSHPANMQE